MLFATDTSTLVILRRLGWLNLCSLRGIRLLWPPSVTRELRQQKQKNKEILGLLASGNADEVAVQRSITFEGISLADAEVISLAVDHDASILSEDKTLRSKASKLGVPAMSLAGFVVYCCQSSLLLKDDCRARLGTLYEDKLLSKAEYHLLLLSIEP